MICVYVPTVPAFWLSVYRHTLVCASPDTLQHYQLAVNHWERVHPELPISLVDSRAILAFQNALSCGRSAATVNSYTRPIKAILRLAASEECGLLAKVPKIRRISERKRSPLALTVEEFGKVLAYVGMLTQTEGGYPAADWWRAVLLTCWESGLRYTALMSVRTVDLLWGDAGFFSQADVAKDKEAQWFPLQPATLEAIRAIYDPIREHLFPRSHAISTLGKRFRAILDASGIYAPRGAGMRFHRLRRSKASYTELAGGDAQRALGHSARSVTERYLDPRIVGRTKQPPMPLPS
jgi:integrase